MILPPIVPCKVCSLPVPAFRLAVVGEEHIGPVCEKHLWEVMRMMGVWLRKNGKPLEASKGWLKFCEDFGYDPLKTRFHARSH